LVGELGLGNKNNAWDRKVDKYLSPLMRNRTWLIKYYFFIYYRIEVNMKEIGEKLKEARESMGITIEEAATDLKLRPSQLENIEEGNREAFKDVFYLKMFIKNYSKYLGLDYDEMVEEFNEYLFDFTSKISIEDIKKAEKEQRKKEKKLKTVKIASPYTVEKQQQKQVPRFLIIGGVVLVLVIIIYVVVLLVTKEDEEKGGTIVMEGVDYHEFA